MAGHIFETWCFAEILKSYRNSGRRPAFYFYRDFDQVEIDLVIEQDGVYAVCKFFNKKSVQIVEANSHISG